VPERDEEALVHAILRLTDDRAFVQQCKEQLREERERYRWHRVLERLTEYCAEPAPSFTKWPQLPLLASLAISNQATRLSQAGITRLLQLSRRLPAPVRPTAIARSLGLRPARNRAP